MVHNDKDLIDEAAEAGAPSQQSSAGGNMARKVGQRDELKAATGESDEPTSVQGRDKADDGDISGSRSNTR